VTCSRFLARLELEVRSSRLAATEDRRIRSRSVPPAAGFAARRSRKRRGLRGSVARGREAFTTGVGDSP
jgi:hypothetical protein